jgi:hypothetical protein
VGLSIILRTLLDKPAKLLCTVIPAGLDDFFMEVADFMELKQDKSSHANLDMKETMKLISEKYGQKLYSPDYLD